MKRRSRLLATIAGLAMVLFGIATANYTTEAKAPEHRTWAAEKGLPEPSVTIFHAGVGVELLGLVLLFAAWTRKSD